MHPKGSAKNPLSEQEVKHKFMSQCKNVITDKSLADSIFEAIMHIEDTNDIQTVFTLLP